MAYVTPGTVAAGDVATAAAWNVITNDVISFRDNQGVVPDTVRVVRTSDLTYTPATAITWSSTSWDTNSMWSAGSPTIVTIKKTGLYLVTFAGYFTAATTLTAFETFVKVNANTQFDNPSPVSSTGVVWAHAALLPLTAADTVSAFAGVTGTGTFLMKGTNTDYLQTRMTVTMLGATS